MPTIMVPYPYASEDHQTRNAMSLVDRNAGMMVKDDEADQKLIPLLNQLIDDETKRNQMSAALHYFEKPNAVKDIVDVVLSTVGNV